MVGFEPNDAQRVCWRFCGSRVRRGDRVIDRELLAVFQKLGASHWLCYDTVIERTDASWLNPLPLLISTRIS